MKARLMEGVIGTAVNMCFVVSGLMWHGQDIELGSGKQPVDGEEVTFDYVAYNENGARIDSSYNKGRPASTRLGINGLIPGMRHPVCLMK